MHAIDAYNRRGGSINSQNSQQSDEKEDPAHYSKIEFAATDYEDASILDNANEPSSQQQNQRNIGTEYADSSFVLGNNNNYTNINVVGTNYENLNVPQTDYSNGNLE